MDVMKAILTRRSVRKYSSKKLPEATLAKMRQAIRCAPSACNFQPWHFILVLEDQLREDISRAANGQLWMSEAPVIVVACGMPEHAYKRMGGYGNSADVDVAIAIDHLTLAAAAEGLGTCWVGAFDEAKLKRMLNLPPRLKVIVMTPLGYPKSKDLLGPMEEGRRKPETDIFSTDQYGQ